MQNAIPDQGNSNRGSTPQGAAGANAADASGSVADRAVRRSLERRRQAYAQEVRRLIDATFAVLRHSDGLDPRVEAIVREAGLSNQAFYRHFRSKSELLLAVLDDGVRQLRDYLARRVAAAEPGAAGVRAWLEGMAAQATHPDAAAATRPFVLFHGRLRELFPDEVAESEAQLTALVREAIAQAVETGELAGADPRRDAVALYDLAIGWMHHNLSAQGRPTPADVDHLLAFGMGALRRGT